MWLSESVVFPVPGEVVGIGMEGGEGWDVDAVAVFGFEEESGVAAFVEVLFFDEDVEVVGEGPEAAVEEPVGRVKGFASRDWW